MLGAIAAGLSMAGSIYGGVSAIAQANKKNRMLDKREDEINDWYKQELNTDILDTSSSKSALRELRKQNENQMERVKDSAVKRGLSDEAQVAMASDMNESYADAMSKIASRGDERKSTVRSAYLSEQDRLEEMRNNVTAARNSALSALSGNISNVTSAIIDNEAAGGSIWGARNGQSKK